MHSIDPANAAKPVSADKMDMQYYIEAMPDTKLHALVNTAVKNADNKRSVRRLLKLCLIRINKSDNYPYSDDKEIITKALKKIRLNNLLDYISAAAGAMFILLLSVKILTAAGASIYEKISHKENKPFYTEMPCETMYYDMEQLTEDYPNLKLPEYLPEGYTFESAYVVTDPVSFTTSVDYLNAEGVLISLSFHKFKPEEDIGRFTIESDAGSYKTFEKGGVLYEQVTNYGHHTISWEENHNELYILSGVETEENAHKIVFSIK